TDPETGEGIPYAEVTRGQTVSIMGKSCDCWVIEDTGWKSYAEKTTGVTVKEERWEALETTIFELIDTNIPNFPPATQPPFFFPELPESIEEILTRFRSVLFPVAGLLFILGPICLAFRKAGIFIGLGIGVLIDLVVWLAWSSLSETIPMIPSLAEYWYIFLVFSIVTIAVFAGIGFFAGVGLAVLFSGIGGALLGCYVFSFNPWAIIGGFVAGIVWLYVINRLIAKITEKKKEVIKPAPPLPSPPTYPPTAPPPPAIPQTCPSCGAEITPELVYCPTCGQRIIVKRTCPSCGYENPADAKFCAKCGSQLEIEAKPLEKPAPTPAALPLPGEEIPAVEKVLGGIEVSKGETYYGLYFTPNRVIVAKTAGFPWLWAILLVGILLGALIRSRRAKKKFKELSELSSQSILTADKKNFGILYPDITRVEVKKNKIIILTNREKHKFGILRKKEFEDYVNLIRSVLPNKTFVS
ncbi:50S ribosomal protein L32, partial [Candidatus Bathyarchaeota archaeon]|nr:50S ribosomal protein L32 [Candidatus Bathyarchaeota archaeon]